jgi:very-short-patch-repair endonuclease
LWWQGLATLVANSWPDVAVSRSAAAALWELDGFAAGKVPLSVDVLRLRGVRNRSVHRPQSLCVHTVEGIPLPVVSATTAIIGAASERLWEIPWLTKVERLELAFESGLRRKLFAYAEFVDAVHSMPPGFRGKRSINELLRLRGPELAPTESHLETRLVQVLRRNGIDGVERQVNIDDHRGRIGRVDVRCWGVVVVEAESLQWHNNPEAFINDRERRSRLMAAGFPVIEATSQRIEFAGFELATDICSAYRMVTGSDAPKTPKNENSQNRGVKKSTRNPDSNAKTRVSGRL